MTKQQQELLELAGLSITDLPETYGKLCSMIWRAFEIGKAQAHQSGAAVVSPQKVGLKKDISKILGNALSGKERYRLNSKYIKWGLVEEDIHKAIDEFAG